MNLAIEQVGASNCTAGSPCTSEEPDQESMFFRVRKIAWDQSVQRVVKRGVCQNISHKEFQPHAALPSAPAPSL